MRNKLFEKIFWGTFSIVVGIGMLAVVFCNACAGRAEPLSLVLAGIILGMLPFGMGMYILVDVGYFVWGKIKEQVEIIRDAAKKQSFMTGNYPEHNEEDRS